MANPQSALTWPGQPNANQPAINQAIAGQGIFDFIALPTEIQLFIGEELDNEALINLMVSCQQVWRTFVSVRAGMWKRRFEETFDSAHYQPQPGTTYYLEYARRHYKTNAALLPNPGHPNNWSLPARMLIQLINECDFNSPYHESQNLAYLRKTTAGCGLLDVVGCATLGSGNNAAANGWTVVQLVLLHLTFDLSRPRAPFCFEEACQSAYGNPLTAPIFHYGSYGVRFDIHNAARILNFFKTFVGWEHHELRDIFEELPAIQRPQPWHRRFGANDGVQRLGMLWRAAIGTTEEALVEELRTPGGTPLDSGDTDFISSDDDLPQLFLSFDENLLPRDEFSQTIITYLNPYSVSPPCRRDELGREVVAGRDYAMFVGTLRMCHHTQLVVGVLTPVRGEEGVEGWQRLVMVAYDDPASNVSVNSSLSGYLSEQLPDGRDPSDDGAAEVKRYATATESARGTRWLQAGVAGERARRSEATSIIEGNNAARSRHRLYLESHRPGGEAARYYANRHHRRPQLLNDIDSALPVAEGLYAYEGLVLPGGNAILGRWWDLEEDHERAACPPDLLDPPERWRRASGPVLFWNVDLGLSYRIPANVNTDSESGES